MKKITVSILTTLLMLSMVFSSSVFAANEETSAWDSFLGLFSAKTAATSDVGVEYRGHVQNKGDFPLDGSWIQGPDQLGTVGESLRLEAFWIKLTNEVPAGLHIQYRVHVQNKGWMAPVEDGALAGTQGESLQIESVEIKLVDDAGNPAVGYSVEYRGHIQNKGDMPADGSWYKDGEQLGTVGEFLRLEALEVKIVQTKADMTAYNAAVAAAGALTEADYTADSWAALETALATVVTEDNTQAEVDAATAAINDAIDALVPVVKISSFTATGAKTLTVAFNNAATATAADFTVNKGTVKTNIASVTIAADQKSAVIELTSKLTKGDYTVKVAQGTDPALTATTTVQDEKIGSIAVLSDKAPIAGSTAKVGYKVSNQYGEDITKLYGTSLVKTVTGAAITSGTTLNTDGTISFNLISGAKVGDTITVVLVDSATGVSTSKTITLSAAAVPSTITIGTLYNKDGKTLTEDSDLVADSFYLPVSFTDQYGNAIVSGLSKTTDYIVTNLTPAIATFDDDLALVTIDGVQTYALKVETKVSAGDAKVLLIAAGSGANATGTATVAPGLKIDTATITAPETLVTANKETFFPLTIIDNAGNQITTLKAYKALGTAKALNLSVTGAAVKEVNGALYVSVPANQVVADQALTLVVTTKAGKVSTQTVIPKAEAVPTVITGISSKLATSLRNNTDSSNKITVLPTDLVIEDQYGQVIASTDIPASTDIDAVTTLAKDTASPFDITTNGKGVDITFNDASTVTATSDTITYTISTATNPAASAYSKVYTIVKDANLASYSVDAVTPVYVDKDSSPAYQVTTGPAFVVKATSKSGEVVTLTPAEYNVVGLPVIQVDNTLLPALAFSTTVDTIVKTATITINATGDVLTTPVTYSTITPAAQKFVAVDANDKAVTAVETDNTTAFDFAALGALATFTTTDQYGIETTLTANNEVSAVTYTIVSGAVTFTGNGTQNATVVTADTAAVVNATVQVDGKTVTVQVTFNNGVDTTAPAAPIKNATNGFTLVAGAVSTPGSETGDVVVGTTSAGLTENITLEYKVGTTTPAASATADGSLAVATTVAHDTVVFNEILLSGTTNHVYVRAVDANGNASAWTDLGALS